MVIFTYEHVRRTHTNDFGQNLLTRVLLGALKFEKKSVFNQFSALFISAHTHNPVQIQYCWVKI